MSASGRRPPFRVQSLASVFLRFLRASLVPSSGGWKTSRSAASEPAAYAGDADAVPFVVAFSALIASVIATAVGIVWLSQNMPAPRTPGLIPSVASVPLVPFQSTPQSLPQVVPVSHPLTVLRTFGSNQSGVAALSQPQETVSGSGGRLYVADTGNHRIAIFNGGGQLIGSITRGLSQDLLAPYSLAIGHDGSLYVLDSQAGQIIEYDQRSSTPKAVRATVQGISLGSARDIVVDAAGDLLVANPASNSVITLRNDLTLLHIQPEALPDGTKLFDQPSAVASGADGTVYVLDSTHNMLRLFGPSWQSLGSWPVVVGDTLHSPRVLPLAHNRVLVSDPVAGTVLLFSTPGEAPQSFAVASRAGVASVPLGISSAGSGTFLITCNGAGEVIEVRIPGL